VWNDFPVATLKLAIRRLYALYLMVAGVALAFPYRPPNWPVLVLVHIVAIMMLLDIKPFPALYAWLNARVPRLVEGVGDWFAILLVPLLYTELAVLNASIFNGHYFDSLILSVERAVFGGLPSRDMAAAWPNLALSEFLHFSYLSYYLIIFGPPFYLYMKKQRAAMQLMIFTLLFSFFAHYIFFIYFPVQGPRYLFPAPGGEIARGYFYNLAHKLLEAGSSQGAAFPSSHVGVSFAQVAVAFALVPSLGPVLLVLSTGLAVGAVYGGFHYATDAIVGLIYGLILFALAPRAVRLLARSRE
jgi:membrane-associated phospholipid phosphatase